MADMDEKLSTILNNPQMMQQIMNLAQSLNQNAANSPADGSSQTQPSLPTDMSALSKIGSLANKLNIDREQQTLLKALKPYLSREKLAKLERAMQAAKMAGAASTFLNAGGLQFLSRG